ncbi:carboxymuconolactone decarboxylase family protein [Ochrovirga pacifica]|uniref:carboxymuconolactone decarboxylase family protein n=1 Tax=Ochrovirga pacifica TaxID=1042376 RepID=UPI0002557FE0|nr:carboxymuconolactone decarboxylase family protein [Ochrovirga pacifica]
MERIGFKEIPREMIGKLMELEQYINNSTIEMQVLELMRLRVAQLNGCAYCIDMHYKELIHLGETNQRLSLLMVWEESRDFTEKEKAVLHFTEKLTKLNGKPIGDEDYKVIEKHFKKKEIAMLTMGIAQINTWTRLMKTFQIEAGNYQVNK